MWSVLKDLAVAGGTAAVEAIVGLIRGKPRDTLPSVDVTVSEPPHPGFVDIEHQRAQERASIALSKAAEARARGGPEDSDCAIEEGATINVDRTASTARPPRRKSGSLPKK